MNNETSALFDSFKIVIPILGPANWEGNKFKYYYRVMRRGTNEEQKSITLTENREKKEKS